jgi:hypothetical protein
MEDIPIIACSISDNFNDFSIININFRIKYQVENFIDITLYKSYVVYQQLITKSNIQLNKLYKLIINGLNKEPNYQIDIKLEDDINFIHLDIIFNSDIIEQITLIKQLASKTIELLVDKVKKLERKISSITNKKIHVDGNYYDITTENLDISTSGSYFKSQCDFDNTLHKFTNIKTITIHSGLVEYLFTPIKELYDYRNNINARYIRIFGGLFNIVYNLLNKVINNIFFI